MKLDSYKSDPLFLVERHLIESKKVLVESCQGLSQDQIVVVEGIYNDLLPLIKMSLNEAALTADQVKQLFGDIEQKTTASGGNRTLLGKGKDVATKANQIIDNIGKWLQDTTPVKAFDQKFEDLKGKVSEKFPEVANKLGKLGQLAKENPGKTAAIVGILTALASLAGGPVGGAIAGQVLRGSVELLKGEKLSTAIGKGIKTAVFGYLSGKAFEMLGKFAEGLRIKSLPFGPESAGFEEVTFGATKTIRVPGMEWTEGIEGVDIIVDPEMASNVRAAQALLAQGGDAAVEGFDQLKDIAEVIKSPDYKAMIVDKLEIARQDLIKNDSLLNWITSAKQGLQAMSQGAVAAAGAAEKKESIEQIIKKTPVVEALIYNLKPLNEGMVELLFKRVTATNNQMISEGVIWEKNDPAQPKQSFMQKVMGKASEFGKNLTTKVTASKLMSAWNKAGAPTDSDDIAEFLKGQGVNADVVAQSYQGMKLPPPGKGKSMAEIAAIKKELQALPVPERQQLLALLTKPGAV